MNDRLRRAAPDILIIALLFVVPLIVFFPQTVGGKTLLPLDNLFQWQPYRALAAQAGVGPAHNPLISDLVLENLPWKQFARSEILSGRVPLWQPDILAGTPFLAAGQSSMLYPFSLLFLFLPITAAYGWFTVIQLWLAGVWMFVLMRVLGVRRGGGLIAALTYQLSAFFVVSVVFPMIIATAAWLPLEIAMIELVIRQQPALGGRPATIPWAAAGAAGLGMAALAGHVEALYFTLLVMGFYAAWRLISETLIPHDVSRWRWLAIRAAWLLAMVVAGLALGAVQIVPAYELASHSFRQGAATYQQVLGWAYPARRVLAFLMPNFFGSPAHHSYFDLFRWAQVAITANAHGEAISSTEWGLKNYVEGGAYVGILPLLLALAAVVHWIGSRIPAGGDRRVAPGLGAEQAGRPYRAIFAVLGALSVTFIFGTPTYALLYYGLPFINQSHAPFRWVWPLTLCVAALAGFGVEALAPATDETAGAPHVVPLLHRRLAGWLGWGAIIGGAAVIVGVVVSRLAYGALSGLVQRAFDGLAQASYAFPDARAFYSYEALNALIFGAILLAAGGVIRLSRSARSVRGVPLWQALGALLVAADLIIATCGFYPAADPALLDLVPPSLAWLRQQQAADPLDPWRLAVYEQPGADTLNANIAWLNGLQDISGYDSLIPAQYADYMRLIQEQGDLPYNRIAPIYAAHAGALDSPLLDLLGVRYVISETPLDNPRYMPVYHDGAVTIYENAGAAPRAFTLPASSTVRGAFAQAALAYDVRHYVIIDAAASLPELDPCSARRVCRSAQGGHHRLRRASRYGSTCRPRSRAGWWSPAAITPAGGRGRARWAAPIPPSRKCRCTASTAISGARCWSRARGRCA